MGLARLVAHPDDDGFAAEGGLAEAFTRGVKAVHIDVEDDPRLVVAFGVGERVEGHADHLRRRYPPDTILLVCDVSVKILTARGPLMLCSAATDWSSELADRGQSRRDRRPRDLCRRELPERIRTPKLVPIA